MNSLQITSGLIKCSCVNMSSDLRRTWVVGLAPVIRISMNSINQGGPQETYRDQTSAVQGEGLPYLPEQRFEAVLSAS